MRTDLTPAEVVHWLRAKARELSRTADTIEQTFSVGLQLSDAEGQSSTSRSSASSEASSRSRSVAPAVDVADVVDAMEGKAMRRATIAARLAVPEYALEPVLTEDNGFERNERGWYTYGGNGHESSSETDVDDDS